MFKELVAVAEARSAQAQAEAEVVVLKQKLTREQTDNAQLRGRNVFLENENGVLRQDLKAIHNASRMNADMETHYMREITRLSKKIKELESSPDRRLDRIESYLLGMQANALGANVKVEVNNG